jgi:hypothetical protein
MDALTQLEPVARPLLRQVDEALATLGAPAEHQVWRLLRQVGATPADSVTIFADLTAADPSGGSLRVAAGALREQADAYLAASMPASVPWAGGAGEAYAARAAALGSHLYGDGPTDGRLEGRFEGPVDGRDSMAGRLAAMASYMDEVADWQARSRHRIARVLADVLGSAQAVALRAATGPSAGPGASAEVLAAADIGAHVLVATADAIDEGRDLHRAWDERLAELPYRGPVDAGAGRFDATIRLSH